MPRSWVNSPPARPSRRWATSLGARLIYDRPLFDHLSGHAKDAGGGAQVSGGGPQGHAAAFLGLREDIFTLSAQGEGQLPLGASPPW